LDGRDSEKLGGTAQVVRFHLQGSVPGQIDRRRRVALARLGLDEETLVYHLQATESTTPRAFRCRAAGSPPTRTSSPTTCCRRRST
jgi:hypothetical protein